MDIKNKRAQVIVNLHKLRRKAKELEATQSTGIDKKADIEACRGEINVLQKELDSIDDGGHTTFMNAKNMLEPKKGISSKNRRIKWRKAQIGKRIEKLEASQEESDVTDEERTETAAKLAKFREELASLDEEKAALKDFNHTRFMAANKDDGQGDKQNTEIEQVNKKIHDLRDQVGACEQRRKRSLDRGVARRVSFAGNGKGIHRKLYSRPFSQKPLKPKSQTA